jgi:hypothetical protein
VHDGVVEVGTVLGEGAGAEGRVAGAEAGAVVPATAKLVGGISCSFHPVLIGTAKY